jgi:hypothetical protein
MPILKPSRKMISDYEVCLAYQEHDKNRLGANDAVDILVEKFNIPYKVCWSACERAEDRGLIEYGSTLRLGWLTNKGKKLIKENQNES